MLEIPPLEKLSLAEDNPRRSVGGVKEARRVDRRSEDPPEARHLTPGPPRAVWPIARILIAVQDLTIPI